MSHGLLLDEQEKRRFSEWLRLQIETSKGMQEQMKKLNLPEAVMKRETVEQAACTVVLRMIESGETLTL